MKIENYYKVLRSCYLNELEKMVIEQMNEGFSLLGGCFIEMAGSSPMFFCQTVYKVTEIEDRPKKTTKKKADTEEPTPTSV